MSDRGTQLHATADVQVAELVELLKRLDETALRLPCLRRERLGDGTVAAAAQHTADNYQRIAELVQTSDRMSAGRGAGGNRAHRIPRFLRAVGHGPTHHRPRGGHTDRYTADKIDPAALIGQLSRTRDSLGRIAELTNRQLDAIPPKDGFRFCDGQRTFEQVLASLLKHQGHQIDALTAAIP